MLRYRLINEELIKKNENKIKTMLKQVLDINCISCDSKKINEIYKKMIEFINDGSANIIGAVEDDVIYGFIWIYTKIVNNVKRYHINYFVVDENKRQNGIGKKLICEVYKMAKENGIKKVELMVTAQNENAVNFYKKQEFEIERFLLCKEI